MELHLVGLRTIVLLESKYELIIVDFLELGAFIPFNSD